MYIVILCSLIALCLTYFDSVGRLKGGMKWAFVIVAILGMIHYDYGNDYMSYYEVFHDVTRFDFDLKGILEKDYFRDPGWVLLCWFFKPIGGFFMMVAVLSIIQNYLVYRFIKRYVERKWWHIAIFVYLFATSFYLMSFSMMRQSFVIFMFLGMWRYIEERKWWIPFFAFWSLSFVHSSALILLPFAFWGYMPVKNGKFIGVTYVCILLLMWFSRDSLNGIFSHMLTIDDTFAQYADTYGQGKVILKLGMGFIINLIPFVLSVIFLVDKARRNSTSQKLMVALSAISYMVAPFSQIIPLTGRLSMYFSVYKIGAIPLIYSSVQRKNLRLILLGICLFMFLYDYVIFFKNPVWVDKYTTFHTIFEVLF